MWAVSFKSVRHRRHLPGERILEAEVAQVPHPLRKQDAVEVIDLVFHATGVKPLNGPLDRSSVQNQARAPRAAAAEDRPPPPRPPQAPLPASALRAAERRPA